MSDAPSLRESQALRLGDLLRELNGDLRAADEGKRSIETRVGIVEDALRETICALLGATNPVVLESNRRDGSSLKSGTMGVGE